MIKFTIEVALSRTVLSHNDCYVEKYIKQYNTLISLWLPLLLIKTFIFKVVFVPFDATPTNECHMVKCLIYENLNYLKI
jgi:hypothetical protein